MDDGGSPTTGMKKLSNRLMKLFGVDTDDVTEEEIISMVNEGHEQGVLQANEAEMIHKNVIFMRFHILNLETKMQRILWCTARILLPLMER